MCTVYVLKDPETTESNTGRILSEETRKKMSESAKRRGLNKPLALTPKQRSEIKQKYQRGNGSKLAKEYGVSKSLIYLVVKEENNA